MKKRNLLLRATSAGAIVVVASMMMVKAQTPATQSTATQAPKTAEQQFKNIQVLKGVPADQVIPTMQFIANSLGVECDFCHVERAFEKDDRREKQTARRMIEMQMAINKTNFKGETEVTCNTCHRGSPRPMAIPAVMEANAKPAAKPEATEAQPPKQDADAVIAKYIAALGGEAALGKITTLNEKGKAVVNGHETAVDIYAKAPDARASALHTQNGDSMTVFNGTAGWLASPGRPVHDMNPTEASAAKLDAMFTFPAQIAKEFTRLRVGRPEKIDDKPVTVVLAMREGQPPVRLYFDEQSGLLVRMVRYAESPLGRNPTEVNYADYREENGVKMPHQWTIARPNGRFTIEVNEVKVNAAIDAAIFVRPPDPPPAQQAPATK